MLISFRHFDSNRRKKILLSVLYFVKGETFPRFSFLFFGTILSERGQFRKKFREEHLTGYSVYRLPCLVLFEGREIKSFFVSLN